MHKKILCLFSELIINAATVYLFSIYNSTCITFGFKGMNVLPKAVLGKWIKAIMEKKDANLPRILWVLWRALLSFSSNTYLNSPFPVTTATTIYYLLLVLLDSLLSSPCLQQLICVLPLYLSKLILASPNSKGISDPNVNMRHIPQ